jgi:hypothetical protein
MIQNLYILVESSPVNVLRIPLKIIGRNADADLEPVATMPWIIRNRNSAKRHLIGHLKHHKVSTTSTTATKDIVSVCHLKLLYIHDDSTLRDTICQ